MKDHIERSVELKAPVERVWAALADPQQFGAWFRVKIQTPFMPGQPASGNMLYPGYEHIRWEVTIQRMEEPRLFSFTWHPFAVEPGVDYSGETPTLVEFRLEPIDGGTRLTVTESGFSKIPAHRYADAFRSNSGGWEAQIDNIRAYVER